MKILVTGTAGFIGYFVAKQLLEQGHEVVGIDNVNDYYDVNLKEARLNKLKTFENFKEERIDLVDKINVDRVFRKHKPQRIINLAAQAGVTYSLKKPQAYIDSNITGFLNILEGCRDNDVKHLVFASTASVYGGSKIMPQSEKDSCNHPLSLYGATKKANEMMAHSYSHLFSIPITGLRFFNCYGPWGRPDMALFIFVKNIIEGKPINVHNFGKMKRDFTYVEDIAKGVVLTALGEAPVIAEENDNDKSAVAPFKIYNIGNNSPVDLMYYIECIEKELDKKAIINFVPIQPAEIEKSWADSSKLMKDYGYKPQTKIEDGVHEFVKWYREFYGV